MGRNRYYEGNLRPEMASFIPRRVSRVLEVGGSDGAFSANFGEDVEYWCMDPGLGSGDVIRQKRKKVILAQAEKGIPELPGEYFDLVVANDVLEHLVDPESVLKALRRAMAPDARLIGSVPNVRYLGVLAGLLIFKDWKYREQGVLDDTHLRFFTEKSLRRSLVRSEFFVEELRGINSVLRSGGWPKRMVTFASVILSAGNLRDSRFPQIGFRARR